MVLKVKRLRSSAKVPTKAHKTDAGFDLYASEYVDMEPSGITLVPTGIAVEIPEGYCGIIKDRSSMVTLYGHQVVAGVIDSHYRGEVKIALKVIKEFPVFSIEPGLKIAQLVIVPIPDLEIKEVDDLTDTDRGEKGFGSSGSK